MKHNPKFNSYQFAVLLIMVITFIIFTSSNFLQVYSQEDENEDKDSQNTDINITNEQRDNKTFYFPETGE